MCKYIFRCSARETWLFILYVLLVSAFFATAAVDRCVSASGFRDRQVHLPCGCLVVATSFPWWDLWWPKLHWNQVLLQVLTPVSVSNIPPLILIY